MSDTLLYGVLAFLAASVFFVPLFKRGGLESILGYIAAGVTIGPWGFSLITDVEGSLHLAELGVVLLLFLIGLELQPSKLWQMKYRLFGLGGLQLLLTTFVFYIPLSMLSLPPSVALAVAFALSLSSTAFTLQSLTEHQQLNTEHGRSAFSILLMQDIAAIPAIALIPIIWSTSSDQHETLNMIQVFLAFLFVILASRFAVRPFFRYIAKTNNRELFTATTLFVVLGTAVLMHSVGLSMALGTFIAGVLLADSEYRHAIETDIAPFKGLFMGLFFVSVGMSLDFHLIEDRPFYLLGLVISYMILKCLVLFTVAKIFKSKNETALLMALNLTQGSEFAFVLVGSLLEFKALDLQQRNTLILVVILSMCISPFLVSFYERRLTKKKERLNPARQFDKIDEKAPVIIAGFGRFGQMFGRILRLKSIDFVAIDNSPDSIDVLRKFGHRVYYGDASRMDLLETAGVRQAKYFILAIDNVEKSLEVAKILKKNFPNLKIFARARNRGHAFDLMEIGIDRIKRETFDSAVDFTEELLEHMGFSADEIRSTIDGFKKYDNETLKNQFAIHKDEKEMISISRQAAQQFAETLRDDSRSDVSKGDTKESFSQSP